MKRLLASFVLLLVELLICAAFVTPPGWFFILPALWVGGKGNPFALYDWTCQKLLGEPE